MTLVLSAEWRVSNCAKIHPLRRLRDNVSLEAVAGGIRGGKGGKVRMYFGSNINRLPDELGIKRKANKGIKDYF